MAVSAAAANGAHFRRCGWELQPSLEWGLYIMIIIINFITIN